MVQASVVESHKLHQHASKIQQAEKCKQVIRCSHYRVFKKGNNANLHTDQIQLVIIRAGQRHGWCNWGV